MFNKASEDMKSLLIENPNTAVIIFVDRLGNVWIGAVNTMIRAVGTPTCVVANLSNTEFVPTLMPIEVLQLQMHFCVAKGRKVPKGATNATKGAPLTTELLAGQTEWTGNNTHLYHSANCCIVPGDDNSKPWLEGRLVEKSRWNGGT